jgi:flagellar FliJ protein
MAFRFNLQSVLEHRNHLKEMAMAGLAQCLEELRKCREQVEWLQEESRRSRLDLDEREKKGLSAREFILANEYLTVLRLHALREEARLPQLKTMVAEARQQLVEAQRKCRALEILRDRQKEQYLQELARREQLLLDEAAINGYLHRKQA